jgi:hypothetical protein
LELAALYFISTVCRSADRVKLLYGYKKLHLYVRVLRQECMIAGTRRCSG